MPKQILITGYYKKNNKGDDIFENIAEKIFLSNDKVVFAVSPIDMLKNIFDNTPEKFAIIDTIILFGGETLNEYFLKTLGLIKAKYQKIKLYGVGVGLGIDPDCIKYYLSMFQYLIVRHKYDADLINSKFPLIQCKYVQDIAFLYDVKGYKNTKRTNSVGLFLSQPKYYSLKHKKDIIGQSTLINNIIKIITDFVKNGFRVKLFSMCCNNIDSESDNYINTNIYNCIEDDDIIQNVDIVENHNFDTELKTLRFAICERFHSHILCLINNIPFVSMGNTHKVAHLLNDLGLSNLIIKSSADNIFDKLSKIDKNMLKNVYLTQYKDVKLFFDKLIKNFYEEDNNNTFITTPITQTITHSKQQTTQQQIPKKSSNSVELYYPRFKTQIYFNNNLISTYCCNLFKDVQQNYKKMNNPADYILMKLFGTTNLEYKWGIEEKIKNKQFDIEQLKWLFEQSIINYSFLYNQYTSQICNIGNKLNKELSYFLNIDYIDQYDRTGVHRHGWKYVIDNLSNNLCSYNPYLIKCDLYVDRTFHWMKKQMVESGIIPYRSAWIGFIHHTLYQDKSGYNCVELLKCPEFVESLKTCKGLIVLSNYLKNNLLKLASMHNIKLPTVYFIHHPTCFVDNSRLWKYGRWTFASWQGEIIQIGSWMRDMKAIYDLKYPHKYALIGKQMKEEYKEISFGDNLEHFYEEEHFTKYPVKLIKYVENDKYDEILSKFVVFIKLNDASAVNTLLECIVRNTPIVINRLPAIEEYLGPKYPLYYNSIEDVPRILNNKRLIVKANSYLKSLNKNFLKIDNFLQSMKQLLITITNHS